MSRVLVIGWDGATWSVAAPLAAEGRLPALSALREGGAEGRRARHELVHRDAAGEQAQRGAQPGEEGALVGEGEPVVGFGAAVVGSRAFVVIGHAG